MKISLLENLNPNLNANPTGFFGDQVYILTPKTYKTLRVPSCPFVSLRDTPL